MTTVIAEFQISLETLCFTGKRSYTDSFENFREFSLWCEKNSMKFSEVSVQLFFCKKKNCPMKSDNSCHSVSFCQALSNYNESKRLVNIFEKVVDYYDDTLKCFWPDSEKKGAM